MSPQSYLIDTSALARILTSADAREPWLKHLTEGVIGYCDLTELEFLFSARSVADRLAKQELLGTLLSWVPIPDQVYSRARRVQQQLTEQGGHRSAGAVDLLLAATADLSGLTLLHYDRDFETVAAVTGQPVQWLATPGSL
ncbi:putative nucleic acid-binding protein [Kitasatospora sp. MAA4]|uniref:PIN domain nuclease n=1 Tax=Kitasatospora sp. MAA4 TaxID=3035093 RepID=UPI002477157C|nr:PIN domain nuclease [Kitasatospora sp. MAA4]MDH6137803.1 putative nucleic acid-binding protein [Kitasatospora sp. MAA4]